MSMWGPLPTVFDRACSYHAAKTAIIDADRRLSYSELAASANRVGHGLREAGLERGDRVGLLMPNTLEFITTQHGIWKAGGACVQMPARASAEDLRSFLAQSEASVLIYDERFDQAVAVWGGTLPRLRTTIRLADAPGARGESTVAGVLDYAALFDGCPDSPPEVPVGVDDLAFVGFTSGTTGTPKGVRYTHEAWSHYLITAGLEVADTRPGEVFAHGAPLTHFTQIFVLPTLLRGGTNVLLPGLDVDQLLDTITKERVTATAVVPTVVYLLLDHPRLSEADLTSLRTMIYAGSPMAPERLRQALRRFGPIFVQTYAGSEPGFMTTLRKEDHDPDTTQGRRRLSSAGRPMFHVELSIQDERDQILATGEIGEICARQDGQMIGYLDPATDGEAIRDGWVHSGDVGFLDPDGFLYLVDRKKDMIVSGGFNVFPRQVEDVLLEHPAVAGCAVFGVPDPKWGEAVKAVVTRRAGAEVEASELIALVKERKGSVWAPKTVDFADQLPLNPSGKADKKALRAPYWANRDRSIG